jgi:SAM-dependent methyltransferase
MITDALRERAFALERRLQRGLQRSFERRLGIETRQLVDLNELGVAGAGRIYYAGTPAVPFRAALRRLRPSADDVFVDIGSGKGQAAIIAAQLPLARVIGVELAADLTAVARANVARVRPDLRCPSIDLVSADATEWPIPDDVSIIYMYCPFIGEVFRSVAERIFASFDTRPRPLLIVYGYPWEHNWLIARRRVRTVDVAPATWPRRPGWWDSDHAFVTYQVTAADGSAPLRAVTSGGYGWDRAMEYWSAANDTEFLLRPPGGGPPLRSSSTRQ